MHLLNSSNPLMADLYEDYTREQLMRMMRMMRERDERMRFFLSSFPELRK